jgi:pre-mRNA-splicing factor SYF2
MPPKRKRAAKAADPTEEKEVLITEKVTVKETNVSEQVDDVPRPVEQATALELATTDDAASKARERLEKFKALKAQAKKSTESNLKEAAAETQRLASDPSAMIALNRKRAIASHNLLKADTIAAGEDFERKRAWDWTVEESEKWDKRMDKKEKHREDVAFQDYRQDARKVYKRQMRTIAPDMEAYKREKLAAVQKAAQNGELEIFETEDGELVAVDRAGTFYSTADSTNFTEQKPDNAAVDRLVDDLKKAETQRLKKRKDRGKEDGEADVTYINDKNKGFNQKLARFYNKYTAEIRDSFERGTMI